MSSPPPPQPIATPFEELDEFITGLLKHRIDVDELLSRVMQGLERVTGEVCESTWTREMVTRTGGGFGFWSSLDEN